ncbi:plasmid partitioning protein RepB [Microvirga sp. 2TAF3]|uniref:plasmid partitioning protein RepB n=1 Tax=Microvirga sp. 2TAF3 TaxID=3233014 RepID=UPI003F990F17
MSKRANHLDSLLSPIKRDEPKPMPERKPSATPGSIKVMGMALESLNADAEEVENLRSQLASGDRVLELDPKAVDHSPFRDRLTDTGSDPVFEALKASIADGGQQVPILVRLHPKDEGRYQAAYGHRRLRAARELGQKVKALVRPLTDAELVVAQGKENLDRADLSFIERAQFAATLEERGFDRATIMSAVEPNKGNLSVLLSVAKAIPADVIAAIGPAPKIGRPRWLELTEALRGKGALDRVLEATASDRFQAADSHARFNRVLTAATGPQEKANSDTRIITASGRKVAKVSQTGRDLKISVDKGLDAGFATFLADRFAEQLPSLAQEYAKAREEGT